MIGWPRGVVHCVKRAAVAVLAFHLDHARLQAQLAGRFGCRIALFARNGIECNPDNFRARASGRAPPA
jgi:hypothetical protein